MKKIYIGLFFLAVLATPLMAQVNFPRNELSLKLGYSQLQRQDLIFSPFIHTDIGLPNIGLAFRHSKRFYQKVELNYFGFNPMISGPFTFYMYDEKKTAFPHAFNFIDLYYSFGKQKALNPKSYLTLGGAFISKIQMTNYVYGRIGSFGYFAPLGLGVFGTYEYAVGQKTRLGTSLQLPVLSWVARSPYLVNDDEFIENISDHNGFKTFLNFMGDGELQTWNKIQYIDFDLNFSHQVHPKWKVGLNYSFEYIHTSEPRPLASLRNTLNFQTNFNF